MAVKTEFTRDDFVSILSSYDLSGYVGSHLVEQGTVQTNYFVDTVRGRFVLRYYESRSRESVLFESDLLAYLSARDYPCPGQVKDRRGADVGLYCDRPYGALEQADGLAIVTEWNEFRHPDFEIMRRLLAQPVIFDGRNLYEPAQMKALGFAYYCIGR